MGRRPVLSGALLLVPYIALAGCSEPPVLEIGPVGYGADEIALMNAAQREQLADLTAFGLVIAGGRADEVVEPFVDRELRSLVLQRLAMEVAVDDAGVDDSVLRAAYDRAPMPELVVRHLVIMSERWRPEEHRDSARAVAEQALRRARSGESFEELAGEYSDEPGAAERGGLLEPGREGSWVGEFWAAANDLEEGELSPVVETEYGFHVIRLEERGAVPFEEVRSEVLERFVDLPSALSRAEDWAESQASGLRVDPSAIRAWQAGEPVEGPVATWEGPVGGSLSAEELDLYVATLDEDSRDQVEAADSAGAIDMVHSLARNFMLVERARNRGIEPSVAQRVALERRWGERLGRWAEALGFTGGMSRDQVRTAALEAQGAQRQGAAIARSEIQAISGVLRALYPATEHEPTG